jgi:lipoate-protein ligase B
VALNVTTPLAAFDLIVPCGLRQTRVTSLAALGGQARPTGELAGPFARAFAAQLGRPPEQIARP